MILHGRRAPAGRRALAVAASHLCLAAGRRAASSCTAEPSLPAICPFAGGLGASIPGLTVEAVLESRGLLAAMRSALVSHKLLVLDAGADLTEEHQLGLGKLLGDVQV